MALRVANAISVAVRTLENASIHDKALDRKALLFDAYLVGAALGSVWRQTGIDRLKTKVDYRRPTWNDTPTVIHEGMR